VSGWEVGDAGTLPDEWSPDYAAQCGFSRGSDGEAAALSTLWRLAGFQGMKLFARLEADGLAWGDADLSAGSGIATNSSFTRTDAENAKSAQFDALAGGQGLLEALEYGIHRSLCLGARETGALDYMMDDVLFNQRGNLAGATAFDCTTTCRIDATGFGANVELAKGLWLFFREKRT
jgi:hypothetical protein